MFADSWSFQATRRIFGAMKLVSLVHLGLGLSLLGGGISACNTDPSKGKSKATVAEAVSAGAPGTPAANGTAYDFSQANSKIEFVGAKVTGKHDGSLGTFSGKIQSPDGRPESSTVSVEIDAASIAVDVAKLTNHLKSADFFDVEKFPKVTFVSTSVKPGGEKNATHTVTGNLTMHGISKSITFPATIRLAADSAQADAEFAINRKDFGIVYPGKPDDLISDEVLIKLTIRAKKSGP
jgi:polyisoprenoid-binding protein YceI